jgi:predicted dehydrogenase
VNASARARIAVVGAGLIGRRHVEAALAEPTVELVGIVDPAEEAREVASRAQVPWFATMPQLFDRARPDGVIVATPNQMHLAHGLEAIAGGVATLIEKPIADSVAAARELVASAEARGVALAVGHHRRHNPLIGEAKAIIAAGRLGRIVTVHGSFWLMKPDDYFAPAWRRSPGAGPILVNLIHDVDLLRHLVGDVVEVQAMHSNAVRGHPVEETAVVLLRFANGALGTLSASDTVVAPWSWEQTAGENPAYPQTEQGCYQIGGTHGALSVPTLELWTNVAQRGWWEPFNVERRHLVKVDPLANQMRQFARVARGNEAPLVPGREGLATLEVIEAIKRAAESGQPVRLA